MTRTRVIVVDDVEVFRAGVVAILSTATDVEVVAEAADGTSGLAAAERVRPDVALVDLKMPSLDGVELTRRLRVAVPTCQVLVLTTFDEDHLVFDALRAGAAGYLLKDLSTERLLDAIRIVAAGGSILNPAIASKVIAELVRSPAPPATSRPDFSKRELEVLALLGHGASNKEIARALHVAEGTVKNHVTNILIKLRVTDRTQAALRARELAIVS